METWRVFLVDSSGEMSWLPERLLRAIGIDLFKHDERFVMANGREIINASADPRRKRLVPAGPIPAAGVAASVVRQRPGQEVSFLRRELPTCTTSSPP